jgi:hypothetical protein
MSLCNVHREVDQWGKDMVDTFNYEYWAHKTHRLVTEALPELDPQQIIDDARNYFQELARLQSHLCALGYNVEYVQRVGEYLGSVYLWPLHILIHPYGATMEAIGEFIEQLNLPVKEDKLLEAAKLASGDYLPQGCSFREKLLQRLQERRPDTSEISDILFSAQDRELQWHFLSLLSEMNDTPLLTGISLSIKALNIKLSKEPFKKSEWLRFKVAMTVQRGMYNCWDHEYPVIFRERSSHPLVVFATFFEILKETLSAYQPYFLNRNSYELSGICP